jgi:hypothetical protein
VIEVDCLTKNLCAYEASDIFRGNLMKKGYTDYYNDEPHTIHLYE